jgi:hypothetical protein
MTETLEERLRKKITSTTFDPLLLYSVTGRDLVEILRTLDTAQAQIDNMNQTVMALIAQAGGRVVIERVTTARLVGPHTIEARNTSEGDLELRMVGWEVPQPGTMTQ